MAQDVARRALRGCHGSLAIAAFFSFFINLLMLTLPLYVMQLFMNVMTSRSVETLVLLTFVAVMALAFAASLEVLRARILLRVGLKVDRNLADRLLAVSLRERRQGDGAQVLRDLQEIRSFLTGPSIVMLFDVPWVPIYVGVIALFHPVLGIVAAAGTGVLFTIAVINEMLTRKRIQMGGAVSAGSITEADGFTRNIDAIRAMGMHDALLRRWQRHHWAALSLTTTGAGRIGLATTLAMFVRRVLQIALMGTGAFLYISDDITAGAMIAGSLLMGQGLRPVEGAIGTWRTMVSARAAYQRIKLMLTSAGARAARPLTLPTPDGFMTVERVVVTFPGTGKTILKGISFKLPAGKFLGIVGPSGAGKSTLARAMIGALAPTSGTVRLDGAELKMWNTRDLGLHIGYMPQDVQLFAGTVADNIARMAEGASADMIVAAAKKAGVHDAVLRLPQGYATKIGDAGSLLSGGEKQRLALARALFGTPRVLLFDEPNANLDTEGEQALRKALAAAKTEGRTVIVVTHRPSLLADADLVLVLRDGLVTAFGSRREVLAGLTAAKDQGAAAASVHYLANAAASGAGGASP